MSGGNFCPKSCVLSWKSGLPELNSVNVLRILFCKEDYDSGFGFLLVWIAEILAGLRISFAFACCVMMMPCLCLPAS